MEILAPLIPYLKGTLPTACFFLYLIFRDNYQEKETQRLRTILLDFKSSCQKEIKELSQIIANGNKDVDERMRKIEFRISKIWSDFGK